MISRNVLAKGQIVIPKTLRDHLGINVGDEILIELENEKMILSKKQDVVKVFADICEKHSTSVSMKAIKKELESRYQED